MFCSPQPSPALVIGTSSVMTRYGVNRWPYWRWRSQVSHRPYARPGIVICAETVPLLAVLRVSMPCWVPTAPGPSTCQRLWLSGPTNVSSYTRPPWPYHPKVLPAWVGPGACRGVRPSGGGARPAGVAPGEGGRAGGGGAGGGGGGGGRGGGGGGGFFGGGEKNGHRT